MRHSLLLLIIPVLLAAPLFVHAAQLSGLISVVHGGQPIVEGVEHYRSDFSLTNSYTFNFTWPNAVGNLQGQFYLIKGTFGALDGAPQPGVNYTSTNQSWASNVTSVTKSLGFQLGGTSLASGTYTLMVAELSNTSPANTMTWFASGGAEGTPPINYSFITFDYTAADRSDELPGALASVETATNATSGNGKVITDNAEVYRDELNPLNGTTDGFWRFRFNWPNAVANQQALLFVFRGPLGSLEGGAPAAGVNYGSTQQAWAAGENTIGKFINLPPLNHPSTSPSTYTVMVAEATASHNPGAAQKYAEWFASGGTQGSAPRRYSTLSFEFKGDRPTEPDPVIIIPGILGSWEKNGKLIIDPVLHTYDDLINTFVLNGFVEGDTIFSFPYEWRDTNIFTAGLLRDKINEVQAICGCDKVDIVAHSMGGLVARYYIQSGLYENDVDQLIFIATPHLGSPKAYLAWEGGEFGFQFRDNILEFILRQEARKKGFDDLFDYIQNRPVNSVQQLLPTFDYLLEQGIGLRPYPIAYPQNTFLENLNSNVASLLSSGVSIANVVGNTGAASTISVLRVVDSPSPPKWPHGYPEFFSNPLTDRGLEYGAGDDTVTLESARFVDSNVTEINAGHNAVVKASQALVYETLVGEAPAQVSNLQQDADLFLLLQVLSPVDIQIVAPDGKRLGKDFETGNEFDEIQGAFYSGFRTDNEYAVIPNPQNGEYKVLSQGTDNGGKYTLVSGYASPSGLVQQGVASHVLPGDTEEMTLTINNQSPEDLTIEDTTVVTYGTLLVHIEQAAMLGWIIDNKFKKLLNGTAKKAEKLSDQNRGFAEKALLYGLLVELRVGLKKGKINDEGSSLLKEDVEALLRE